MEALSILQESLINKLEALGQVNCAFINQNILVKRTISIFGWISLFEDLPIVRTKPRRSPYLQDYAKTNFISSLFVFPPSLCKFINLICNQLKERICLQNLSFIFQTFRFPLHFAHWRTHLEVVHYDMHNFLIWFFFFY